jgi:UDP-N-acetylglucosamine--N-acetylmuramyl-(pentapeptide) pyrophosphoryl-undecaprenol N-acetylglucosamine transferase
MTYRVVLAGGGTAGHIEPALAVADALVAKRKDLSCEFLGTNGALETLLVPKRGYRLRTIPKVVLPRQLRIQSIFFPIQLVRAFLAALRQLKGVDALIGFGGYVSAPAYLAATIKKIPIVIHEANAKPGWANRLGRHFAEVVAVNFEGVRRQWPSAVLTGMPIRQSIASLAQLRDKDSFRKLHCDTWGFDPAKPVVAVFGGSQGSRHINDVIAEFNSQFKPQGSDLQIIHAVGVNNPLPEKRAGYLPLPYFHDMAAIYGSADLLITRSGAVTCSELATVGKFSILVPLPHGNGEQFDNARALVEHGAAIAIANDEFDADWLRSNLNSALEKAKAFQSLDTGLNIQAADRIADLALSVLEKGARK